MRAPLLRDPGTRRPGPVARKGGRSSSIPSGSSVATPAPRFLDVFRKVAHRKVGGGDKSLPADLITWAGIYADQRIVLRTRPRQIEPHATFLISSNQRLRTSGHTSAEFVDVELLEGVLSEAQLGALEQLLQVVDERPVRVRRRSERVR